MVVKVLSSSGVPLMGTSALTGNDSGGSGSLGRTSQDGKYKLGNMIM